MPDDMGEKTEEPTARKLSEARERGQVAKSKDLAGAILLTAAAIVIAIYGIGLADRFVAVTIWSLSDPGVSLVVLRESMGADAWQGFRLVVGITALMMLVLTIAAYISGLLQVGVMFSMKTIQPKLDSLSPVKGLKRLFSMRTLVRGGMDVLKFLVIGAVVALYVFWRRDQVYALALLGLGEGLMRMGRLVLEIALLCLLVLIILGVIDFMYQKWQTNKDLKMSKHEVKDERKSSEGDPEMRGRRMKLAREMVVQRLSQDVPGADVIVTNPTHFSVALAYDANNEDAPRVIAKGADYVALKIRYIANAHGVPIVERPPLARALYADVPVGGHIHPDHYEAVAEVLAYVYRLEGKAARAG